jgi:hypothetical protein
MKPEEAYTKLQDLLGIAEELVKAGEYTVEELQNEILNHCG